MLYSSQLLADSRFPKQITNHQIFKKYQKFKKIFPEIGLENCSTGVECQAQDNQELLEVAKRLIASIRNVFNDRLYELDNYNSRIRTDARRAKSTLIRHLLVQLANQISISSPIQFVNGKCKLALAHDLPDLEGKPFFRQGESLFKIYHKLNELLAAGKFIQLHNIDQWDYCKKFNNLNLPSKEMKIVFSSDGLDGAWDLATMSMRGIESCQRWDSDRSTSLIGSIVDPFTGIIYLTSGSVVDKFGTRMIKRSVVRFAVRDSTQRPVLILERMYPSFDNATAKLFTDFLKEKTGNKFDILQPLNSADFFQKNCFIPLGSKTKQLRTDYRPYVDSRVPFREINTQSIKGKKKESIYTAVHLREDLSALLKKLNHKFFTGLRSIRLIDYGLDPGRRQTLTVLRSQKNWNRLIQHQDEFAKGHLVHLMRSFTDKLDQAPPAQVLQVKLNILNELMASWFERFAASLQQFNNLINTNPILNFSMYQAKSHNLLLAVIDSTRQQLALLPPSSELAQYLDKVK